MNVEKTDKPVVEISIPTCKAENPNMIETVGMTIDAPKNAQQPQGTPKPAAGPNLSDTTVNKPPVAFPA